MKIKIKKGLDLHLAGAVAPGDESKAQAVPVKLCAVTPDDFTGLRPKPEVKPGDTVLCGQPLLRDKDHEDVKLVSPVAGVVKEVVRGERRKIERVVVALADNHAESADFSSMPKQTAEDVVAFISRAGILARMRQRPYDVVPNPAKLPRDIFVTAIDSNPLAIPMAAQLGADAPAKLEAAVSLLSKATAGKVYVGVDKTYTFGAIKGAEMVEVEGPHPSGNVGVLVANVKPVNKGEVVWTLDIVTLYKLGILATEGRYDGATKVALTGSEVKAPCVLATVEGAEIAPLIHGCLKINDRHRRIISGNVLTGTVVDADGGFLRYPYRQITVIPEGDDVDEFMGWASLSPKKMSASRSFPGHFAGRLFAPDARLLGGRRAMIMSGEYDKMLPMDIMAEYLLKAIIGRDINAMEQLGIYEVSPEDFALCEYVDTSKIPVQQIVRDGLDYMLREVGV